MAIYGIASERQLGERITENLAWRWFYTAVEGVFARLDGLGWEKARLRGKDKVNCQGAVAAIDHNIRKALTKARFWRRTACSKTEVIQSMQAVFLSRLILLAAPPISRPLALT